MCGVLSPLGCTPTLEPQRPGNFHSGAHTMASARGGQTLEGVTIVRAATCLVGRGRKVQVHRVSGEPSSEATPQAEERSGGAGEKVAAFTESKKSPSEQVSLERRPQVSLGGQCSKGRNCQMRDGEGLDMQALEHGKSGTEGGRAGS